MRYIVDIRGEIEGDYEIIGKYEERQGEWIDHSEDYGYVECPFCNELTTCSDNADELHYCWHCGAKLGKGGEIVQEKRPQGEYVDISKLRLMTVEECAGHTIDYAMGWKACVEWIKKGGAE